MTNHERYRAAFAVRAPEEAVRRALARTRAAKRGRAPRFILIAALLAGLLMTGVSAEVSSGSVSNLLAPLFGGTRTELLDAIGRPVGASVSANGYTLTAEAILGDRTSMVIVYSLEREDGQPLQGDYYFDDFQNNTMRERGSLIQSIQDDNPGDNKLQIYQVYSVSAFLPRMLHLSFSGLRLWDQDGGTPVADGPWELSFVRRYPHHSREVNTTGLSFIDDSGTAYDINALSLSALGLHLTGTVPAGCKPDLTGLSLYVTLADGRCVPTVPNSSGYQSRGASTLQWNCRLMYGETESSEELFLIPVDDIVSVTICGVTIPVD